MPGVASRIGKLDLTRERQRLFTLVVSLMLGVLALVACSPTDDSDSQNDELATATVDEVLEIVTLTPVPSATVRTALVEYVVADGDTLSGIADEFGVLPEAIVEANGLPNPDAIFVGQTLMIPAPSEASPES